MDINFEFKNNCLWIYLIGEIDEYSASLSRKKADKLAEVYSHCDKVIFDLKGVSFMDSTGIGFLIGRYKKFQKIGVKVYIANPSMETDKILSISGVYAWLPKI